MKIKNFDTDTCYIDLTIDENGLKIEAHGKATDNEWPVLTKSQYSWLEVASFAMGDKSLTAHLMSSAALLLQADIDSNANAEDEDEE